MLFGFLCWSSQITKKYSTYSGLLLTKRIITAMLSSVEDVDDNYVAVSPFILWWWWFIYGVSDDVTLQFPFHLTYFTLRGVCSGFNQKLFISCYQVDSSWWGILKHLSQPCFERSGLEDCLFCMFIPGPCSEYLISATTVCAKKYKRAWVCSKSWIDIFCIIVAIFSNPGSS